MEGEYRGNTRQRVDTGRNRAGENVICMASIAGPDLILLELCKANRLLGEFVGELGWRAVLSLVSGQGQREPEWCSH